MTVEEASRDSRPKGKKGNRGRLRKKYQSLYSDDDGSLEQKIIVNDSVDDQSKEIDNEDGLPISSLYKNKTSQRALFEESDDNIDRGADDAGNMNGEDDRNSNTETNLKTDDVFVDCQMQREAELSDHLVDPSTLMDVENVKKLKKKKKGKGKETKSPSNDQSIKLNNAVQDEPKMDKMTQGFLEVNEHQQQHADDKETEITDKILPFSEVGQGQGKKTKKRKELSKEGTISNDAYHSNPSNLPQRDEHNKQDTVNEDVKISDNVALPSAEMDPDKRKKRRKKEHGNKASHLEGDNGYHEDVIQDNKANGDTAESDNLNHIFSEGKEQHHKLANEKSVDDGAHDIPVGNQSEDRKIKKKKKKIKSQGNGEVVNKAEGAEPSQVIKLSNGLIIEQLESGTKDGKIAALGKKISIQYTGKLKENGVVFESNAGQAPFKFRLGKGEVIEGWDVGLEGMQVGEKRRLVIPPSMASKGDGHSDSAKIPPDSWLVYDFELVKVH
ncbi:FKBP-type peptidyl-prolyl cis-trans isomerase domain [Sesbania bispinosa]|nr:FKBP-type peptidyl-prolyl cis-trans isomerase domain [Sesbania bispinosa]